MAATGLFLCSLSLWPLLKLDLMPCTMEFKCSYTLALTPAQAAPLGWCWNTSDLSRSLNFCLRILPCLCGPSARQPNLTAWNALPQHPFPVLFWLILQVKVKGQPTAKCSLVSQSEWSCSSDLWDLLPDATWESAMCYRCVCTIQYHGLSCKFSEPTNRILHAKSL